MSLSCGAAGRQRRWRRRAAGRRRGRAAEAAATKARGMVVALDLALGAGGVALALRLLWLALFSRRPLWALFETAWLCAVAVRSQLSSVACSPFASAVHPYTSCNA